MRPCTALGVLLVLYQLLEVSAIFEDTETSKRGREFRFHKVTKLEYLFLHVV